MADVPVVHDDHHPHHTLHHHAPRLLRNFIRGDYLNVVHHLLILISFAGFQSDKKAGQYDKHVGAKRNINRANSDSVSFFIIHQTKIKYKIVIKLKSK